MNTYRNIETEAKRQIEMWAAHGIQPDRITVDNSLTVILPDKMHGLELCRDDIETDIEVSALIIHDGEEKRVVLT